MKKLIHARILGFILFCVILLLLATFTIWQLPIDINNPVHTALWRLIFALAVLDQIIKK